MSTQYFDCLKLTYILVLLVQSVCNQPYCWFDQSECIVACLGYQSMGDQPRRTNQPALFVQQGHM